MHWNGYAGCVMGVGDALGCDGAVRLHGAHRSLILCMAGVIPGQKIDHSARDSMDVHQPCAACNGVQVISKLLEFAQCLGEVFP